MKFWLAVAAIGCGVSIMGCTQTVPPRSEAAILPADHNGPPKIPPPVEQAISAQRMSDLTRVLASDAFEGRSMGGTGEERTVAILIQEFQAAGLEPGGENGPAIGTGE